MYPCFEGPSMAILEAFLTNISVGGDSPRATTAKTFFLTIHDISILQSIR